MNLLTRGEVVPSTCHYQALRGGLRRASHAVPVESSLELTRRGIQV